MKTPVRIYAQPGDAYSLLPSDPVVAVQLLRADVDETWFEVTRAEREAPFAWPEIPGVICQKDRVIAELHRCHRINDRKFVAISLSRADPLQPGAHKLRSYWLPEAGAATLHGPDDWIRTDTAAIDGFDHQHDMFDFTKIMPSVVRFAWHHPANDWWAVDENFERFVRKDVLGWRQDPMQARPLAG